MYPHKTYYVFKYNVQCQCIRFCFPSDFSGTCSALIAIQVCCSGMFDVEQAFAILQSNTIVGSAVRSANRCMLSAQDPGPPDGAYYYFGSVFPEEKPLFPGPQYLCLRLLDTTE